MKFEYTTSFVSVTYEQEERGVWIFKSKKPTVAPNPASLYDDPEYQRLLREKGDAGWELVSVQPLLRGAYSYQPTPNASYGFGYSLTAGYYLFWKRVVE
ncbi:MAG: hypothetical protein ACR2GW_09360 [Pyrinomonadaceae bacterium]